MSVEEEVGAPLFVRKHRAIELTPVGQSFARKLTRSFDNIKTAWRELRTPESNAPLRITTSDVLLLDWLLPVIQAAKKTTPGPDISFESSRELRDIASGDWDVAIRNTRETTYDQFFSETLLRKWHTPLMRPELAQQIENVADLLKFELVQTEISQTTQTV